MAVDPNDYSLNVENLTGPQTTAIAGLRSGVEGDITPTTVNGNVISTGTGTLALGSATLNAGPGGTLGSNAFSSVPMVPQTTTVNGHPLSTNVTVTTADIGALGNSGSITPNMLLMGAATGFISTIGTSSARGLSNEVWISHRTDGIAGTGTAEDPFDGSTAVKFDALMMAQPANTTIHLGVGTFQTDIIARTWRPLSGWKIRGSGMENTTVQAVGTPVASSYAVIGKDSGTQAATESDNVEISDLTIDANYSVIGPLAPVANSVPNFKIGIITLQGSNNVIQRVHGKNQYGNIANSRESFGIRVAGFGDGSAVVDGNKILNCIVDSPNGDYNCPYSVAGGTGSNTTLQTRAEVAFCKAVGNNDGFGLDHSVNDSTAYTGGGVNLAAVDGVKIHDNVFTDCFEIAYNDTGAASHVEVYNNIGMRVGNGIGLVSATASTSLRIYNNRIHVQARNSPSASYGVGIGTGGVSDVEIKGNRFIIESGGSGGTLTAISANSASAGAMADNIFDSTFGYSVPSTFITRNNRDNTGIGLFASVDNSDIQSVNIGTGTFQVSYGVKVVRLDTALTGSLTIRCPRGDSFSSFTIIDPKGYVSSTNTVSVARYNGSGASATINGGSSSIIVMVVPYSSCLVTSDVISGGSSQAIPSALIGYTVSTLPTAGVIGRTAYVTDATTPTYLATLTGGGSVKTPVYDNGTAWVSY